MKMLLHAPCPNCGEGNPSLAEFCVNCGARLTEAGGRPTLAGEAKKNVDHSVLMIALAAVSLVLLLAGFVGVDSAVQQSALFAAAAVFAIFARLAQAAKQHEQAMRKQ
jgi:uncharacterized membrane protein YvbJ